MATLHLKKVKCAVLDCARKGASGGDYLCPDHWMMVSPLTQKQFRRARNIAQRNPLPLNVSVMKRTWRKAVAEAEDATRTNKDKTK